MENELFSKRIDSWKEKLLDLSKRNRLLNYKSRRRGTYVFSEPMENIYEILTSREDGKIELGNVVDGQDAEELKDLRLTLTSIRKSINSNFDELGFNTGYAAFGLLSWQEADHSVYKSPILLIPVRIFQENRAAPFVVSMDSDEDIQINPVLMKKLSDDFGLHIVVPNDHPTLNDYISSVKEAVKSEPQWSVEDYTSLDIFSFQNLIILKDLEKNKEMIGSNPFVKALYSNEAQKIYDSYNEEINLKKIPSEAVLTALDADSSQYEAVVRAHRGDSFVLQGPPGTGKSQTITNIICDQLGKNHRVLFVSEKQAALDVVYKKLEKLGFGDFVLSLHSTKQSKSDIRNQLAKSLELASHRQELKEEALNTYQLLDEEIQNLDTYDDAVHEPREQWGYSFFEIQGKALEAAGAQYLDFPVPEKLQSLNKEGQQHLFRDLHELSEFYKPTTSHYSYSKWQYLKDYNSILSQTSSEKLKSLVDLYPQELSRHKTLKNKVSDTFPIRLNPAESEVFLSDLIALCEEQPNSLPPEWYSLNLPTLSTECSALSEMIGEVGDLENSITKDESLIQEKFEPGFLLEDDVEEVLSALKTEYNSFLKRLFSSKYKNIFKRKSEFTRSLKLTYEDLLKNLEILSHRNSAAGQLKEKKAVLQSRFEALREKLRLESIQPEELNWLKEKLDWLQKFKTLNEPTGQKHPALAETEKRRVLKHEITDWRDIQRLTHEYADESTELETMIKDLQEIFEFPLSDAGSILKFITKLDFGNRADYLSYRKKRDSLVDQYGIGSFLDKIEQLDLPGDQITDIFAKRYYSILLDSDPSYRGLSEKSRKNLDQILKQFKSDDKRAMSLARDRIFTKLQERIPSMNAGSGSGEIAVLKKELKKKSRLMSTRKLIESLPVVLPLLKPCIMMSPITVSNYFMNSDPWNDFDLVIFDEASQVKTEYAIAAIARGKQVIVAGDSKQMPPTDFFSSGTKNYEEEDEETADLESILDDLSVAIPTQSLDWHYRSKDESLIAYSNNKFYGNRLYTFPSTLTAKKESIRFEYMPEGIWTSSHGNDIEARRTAELIFEHIRQNSSKSLGVVAFGAKQADLIENEVLRLRDMNPEYEFFFQENNPEPFFIKNLENVQGDERDVIFLCVGYARDPRGKINMNFGPLTRAGGERRLNVAITRAREAMTVISSIRATDIRTVDTQNENRFIFRDFLDYAERGAAALLGTATHQLEDEPEFDSPFEEDVYNFLVYNGYKLHTQVGSSGYKIDMALLHPEIEGRYVLAIECDGAAYHSSRTARDRDRLRQEVLEDKGWMFYRIWSTVWFNDREAEGQRLLEAVNQAIQNYVQNPETFEEPCVSDGSITSNLIEISAENDASLKSEIPSYYHGQSPYALGRSELAKILTIAAGRQIGSSKKDLFAYVHRELFDKKRISRKMEDAYLKGLDYAITNNWITFHGDIVQSRTSENIKF